MATITKEVRDRFIGLLDELTKNYGLGDIVVYHSDAEDALDNWGAKNRAEDDLSVWFGSGATRLVIGDDRCDWVLKIGMDTSEMDYGAREVAAYEDAVRAGIAKCFAQTELLCNYTFVDGVGGTCTTPVYIMECCSCGYDMISDDSCNYHFTSFCEENGLDQQDADSWDEFYNVHDDCQYADSEGMMEYALSVMQLTEEEKNIFFNVLTAHYVNDLHAGNWGYRGDMLVLIDYAGYGDLADRQLKYLNV
jgi:hypothetical protein